MEITFLQLPSVSIYFVPNNPASLIFQPADIISEARQTSIAALLDACYKLVESYQLNELVCENGKLEERKECDTLVFGSLIKGFKRLGIWPTILTSGNYHGSFSELSEGLCSLHCFVLDERANRSKQHKYCKFTLKLQMEVTRIQDTVMPSGVHESHREHMKEQALK